MNDKDTDVIKQKLDLVKSFLGTDLDIALTVLTYAIAEIGLINGASFHSVVKNVALIWEHVEAELKEGEDDEDE